MKKMKLTRGGMQYFDDGGQVHALEAQPSAAPVPAAAPVPQQNTGGMADQAAIDRQNGMMQIFDPRSAMNPGYNLQNIQNAANNPTQFLQDASGILSGLSVKNQYQAQLAPTMQSNYGGVIQTASGNALNGYGQLANVQGQQQGLANALLAQSQGQGANPAQAELAQNTGANVANQAALMAGQRGAGSNIGLLARQAAQQGAATQQNAAGQAATLQAQQQIAAQQAQANVLNQMGQQNIAQQNAATNLFGTAAGAQNTQNANQIQNYSMAQGINANVAGQNAAAANKSAGGIMGGISSVLGSLFAEGGVVPNPKVGAVAPAKRFSRAVPMHLDHMAKLYHPHMFADGGEADPYDENGGFHGDSGKVANVTTPSMPSDSGDSSSSKSKGSGAGIIGSVLALLNQGGPVPGEPKVDHNAYKNDTVPAMLTPKEIVLPLSVTQSENPGEAAKEFVEKLKGKYSGSKNKNDFKSSLKTAMSNRKVK